VGYDLLREYLRGMTPIWAALTGIAALVALGLGFWNLWVAVRTSRRAEIHIAFRSFVQGNETQTWLVISNRGQATGKDVCVSFDLAGDEWMPQWYAFPLRFPIRMIASGDSVQARVNVSMDDHSKGEGMAFGRISWRDHGREKREYETSVGLSAVPFGGGVTTESVASDLAFRMRTA
jgi:hypothetical protein